MFDMILSATSKNHSQSPTHNGVKTTESKYKPFNVLAKWSHVKLYLSRQAVCFRCPTKKLHWKFSENALENIRNEMQFL